MAAAGEVETTSSQSLWTPPRASSVVPPVAALALDAMHGDQHQRTRRTRPLGDWLRPDRSNVEPTRLHVPAAVLVVADVFESVLEQAVGRPDEHKGLAEFVFTVVL